MWRVLAKDGHGVLEMRWAVVVVCGALVVLGLCSGGTRLVPGWWPRVDRVICGGQAARVVPRARRPGVCDAFPVRAADAPRPVAAVDGDRIDAVHCCQQEGCPSFHWFCLTAWLPSGAAPAVYSCYAWEGLHAVAGVMFGKQRDGALPRRARF